MKIQQGLLRRIGENRRNGKSDLYVSLKSASVIVLSDLRVISLNYWDVQSSVVEKIVICSTGVRLISRVYQQLSTFYTYSTAETYAIALMFLLLKRSDFDWRVQSQGKVRVDPQQSLRKQAIALALPLQLPADRIHLDFDPFSKIMNALSKNLQSEHKQALSASLTTAIPCKPSLLNPLPCEQSRQKRGSEWFLVVLSVQFSADAPRRKHRVKVEYLDSKTWDRR
ncbi:hypothetical protein Y032_0192g1364 [Ancylostoma ceylanicum]|uniref:Uncharacterized protein n=1 Tax=Ancylostoma ceylanicum TaxID=53326 RepID=A0A016SPU0_9BILA|nr:hypothetical protein Y032_0192g1364 [Ancylostoma ceylanicum]